MTQKNNICLWLEEEQTIIVKIFSSTSAAPTPTRNTTREWRTFTRKTTTSAAVGEWRRARRRRSAPSTSSTRCSPHSSTSFLTKMHFWLLHSGKNKSGLYISRCTRGKQGMHYHKFRVLDVLNYSLEKFCIVLHCIFL